MTQVDPGLRHPANILNPVGFPSLAAVRRISLFPVTRRGGDVGPDEARPNLLSVERIIAIESAHTVLEAPSHRWIQRAQRRAAIQPPDRPLLGLRVERAQRYTPIRIPRHVKDEVIHIAVAPISGWLLSVPSNSTHS